LFMNFLFIFHETHYLRCVNFFVIVEQIHIS